MKYPGRLIEVGEKDPAAVQALRRWISDSRADSRARHAGAAMLASP